MAEVSIGLRCPLRIPPPISIQLPGTDFLVDGEDSIAKGAADPGLPIRSRPNPKEKKMMMRMPLVMLEDGGGKGESVNTLSVSIIRERLTFDHTVDYDHGGVQQDQELYQLLYKL